MKKEKPKIETPKDQDHLEVYPEKKQVSAFPERRYIKTNRFLVIIALINLACILAEACIFIYSAQRVNVRVQNNRGLLLYQIDREEKQLRQAEYRQRKVPAGRMIIEDYLKKYITERHSFHGTLDEFSQLFNENSFVFRSSNGTLKDKITKDFELLQRETLMQRRERDVHIYNLHPYYGNLWTAIVETFDFPKQDGPPTCDCSDNSTKCLKCKTEKSLSRQRRRVWIRVSDAGQKWIRRKPEDFLTTSNDNPFGIRIEGYYMGYMPKDAPDPNWDLPPELR